MDIITETSIKDDEKSISSTGTCVTIKSTDHMLWWTELRKHYLHTKPANPDPKISLLWNDTTDGTGKVIDTQIQYINKYADIKLSAHIFNNGTITIQGKPAMMKKWCDFHYPCFVEGRPIEKSHISRHYHRHHPLSRQQQ